MKSRRCVGAGIRELSSDDLLKIFSFLTPHSLARSSLVCTSWNRIITSSLLWKHIYDQSRKCLLQISSNHSATNRINILNGEITGAANWKSQYVKEYHKVLFVLGSVRVKEWKGHSKRVECCRFQMETILTGSSDGVVRSWSTTTLKCLATYFVPNKARIIDLEFDENKILAVSGTEIYIWNRKEGSLLRHFRGHSQSIQSMCYVDPEVLIGCSDGTIRIFDIYSGRCARIFREHNDRVTCIVVDITASFLMSGSADGTVQLCDYNDGRKICCLLPSSPPTEVLCLHLFQQQNILVGGTSSGDVYAWDIRKHKLLWSVRTGPNSITSLHAQFYDPSIVMIGTINGVVTILNTASGDILRRFVVAPGAAESKQKNAAVAEHEGANMESSLEGIPRKSRPPILRLISGMTKIATTHPDGTIRLWQFEL